MYPIDSQLRLADRDRARARKRLVREHGRGRIDAAELEERLGVVASARTYADMAPALTDLIRTDPTSADRAPFTPTTRYARRGHRFGRPFALLPLLVVLAIIAAATGHVPWIAIAIVAGVLVLTAPWRWRRARWAHGRWAC